MKGVCFGVCCKLNETSQMSFQIIPLLNAFFCFLKCNSDVVSRKLPLCLWKQASPTMWCKKFKLRLKSCTWFLFDLEGIKSCAVITAAYQLSFVFWSCQQSIFPQVDLSVTYLTDLLIYNRWCKDFLAVETMLWCTRVSDQTGLLRSIVMSINKIDIHWCPVNSLLVRLGVERAPSCSLAQNQLGNEFNRN